MSWLGREQGTAEGFALRQLDAESLAGSRSCDGLPWLRPVVVNLAVRKGTAYRFGGEEFYA